MNLFLYVYDYCTRKLEAKKAKWSQVFQGNVIVNNTLVPISNGFWAKLGAGNNGGRGKQLVPVVFFSRCRALKQPLPLHLDTGPFLLVKIQY